MHERGSEYEWRMALFFQDKQWSDLFLTFKKKTTQTPSARHRHGDRRQ